MKKNQTSTTALGIALNRALESERPADERIIFDPYARQMAPDWMYWMMKFFTAIGYGEMRGPGVQAFLTARERYVDDALQTALSEGAQQVVILGAGYDSRAYRFPEFTRGVTVFEVDHPATQADKLAKLGRIFGKIPAHVIFVAVDFEIQSLEERLVVCGYRPDLKTFFIWQGVVYYLDPSSVDSTLSFIRRCSGPGSSVIFDYMYRSTFDGVTGHGELSSLRRYRRFTGEGLKFAIPDGQVAAFLEARGFTGVKDVGAQELKELYFQGKNSSRRVAGGYGIVSATVL
ncbi:MAG TPA: SAM-dependent methyltransferase [Anaerolineaceae bacterium]|nr:SAM-dependent methyltransferase [Anaerolineaceae bacterium]